MSRQPQAHHTLSDLVRQAAEAAAPTQAQAATPKTARRRAAPAVVVHGGIVATHGGVIHLSITAPCGPSISEER